MNEKEKSKDWEPTMELRWSDAMNIGKINLLSCVKGPTGMTLMLQQKWISDQGEIDWRNIEII